MEGSDFDFYAQNRPKAEDFPTYEPLQPQVPKKPEEKKGISAGAVLAVTLAGMLLLLVIGGALLLVISPLLQDDVDLSMSMGKGGMTSGDTLYFDTDNIEISVKNHGKGTAYAENITIKISGRNIIDEEIQWPGGDIPSGERRRVTIRATVENLFDDFKLRIAIYYNGEFQSNDSIP